MKREAFVARKPKLLLSIICSTSRHPFQDRCLPLLRTLLRCQLLVFYRYFHKVELVTSVQYSRYSSSVASLDNNKLYYIGILIAYRSDVETKLRRFFVGMHPPLGAYSPCPVPEHKATISSSQGTPRNTLNTTTFSTLHTLPSPHFQYTSEPYLQL